MRTLTLEGVRFLRSPPAQEALAELAAGSSSGRRDDLASLDRLRRQAGFGPDEAGWLLDQVQLRHRARGKLPQPERLLLHEEALQQASGLEVSSWRAARFAGFPRVLDLGAGIGGDSFALAQAGCQVLAYERDPVRAALLEANVQALGLEDQIEVLVEDWTDSLAGSSAEERLAGVQAAFADPARRVGGKRVLGLDAMEPPLEALEALATRVPALLVKVAPGLDPDEVPEDCGLEFVSVRGELKEALLTFGEFRGGPLPVATLLPGPHPLEGPHDLPVRLGAPGAWVYEPDPAVLRAGLVRALGAQLEAWQLDPEIAYLSSDVSRDTPFARRYRVLEQGPFGRKPLARWLRAHGAGRVVVKRRGVPIEPAELARRLPKTAGGPELTVLLSRGPKGPLMILGERST